MERTIFKTLSKVQSALSAKGISKDQRNQHGKYQFRGIDDVLNTLAPILAENGLLIIPSMLSSETRQTQTSQGKPTNHTKVVVEYTLANIEGDTWAAKFEGEALDNSDKSLNKAATAAYKYFLFEVFCIPVKGVDDADAETTEIGVAVIDQGQLEHINGLVVETATELPMFLQYLGHQGELDTLPASKYERAANALYKKQGIMKQHEGAYLESEQQDATGGVG